MFDTERSPGTGTRRSFGNDVEAPGAVALGASTFQITPARTLQAAHPRLTTAELLPLVAVSVHRVRGALIGLGVAIVIWFVAILLLWLAGRRSAAREVATLIPNLLVLFRGLFSDPGVDRGSKFLVGFAIAWLISPIDLIPEFIPVAGPLDDAIVAALVLRYVLRHTDRSVLEKHWRGGARTLDVLTGRLRSR